MPLTDLLPPAGRSAAGRGALLDALVNRAPIGIALTVDRVLIEVNDFFCTLTGYRRSELIGQPARILYPSDEDYRRAGEEIYPQLLHQPEVRIETSPRRKDGQIIYLAFSIALVDPIARSLAPSRRSSMSPRNDAPSSCSRRRSRSRSTPPEVSTATSSHGY